MAVLLGFISLLGTLTAGVLHLDGRLLHDRHLHGIYFLHRLHGIRLLHESHLLPYFAIRGY
jgi:hypothetical protein